MAKKSNINTVFNSESMLLSKKSPFSVQEANERNLLFTG